MITQANFLTKLLNNDGSTDTSERMLSIQYLNSTTNTWETLIGPVMLLEGSFDFSVAVDPKIITWERFFNSTEIGCFPSLRLIDSTNIKTENLIKILSYGGDITLTKSGVAVKTKTTRKSAKLAKASAALAELGDLIARVNFGKLFLKSESEIQALIDNAIERGLPSVLITQNALPGNSASIDKYIQTISELNSQISGLQGNISNLNAQINGLQSSIGSLTAQNISLQASNQTLQSRVSSLQSTNQTQTTRIQQLETQLAGCQSETREVRTHEASKVYSNVVNEITKATETLSNSKYQLSNLSLDLKVLVKNEEDGLKLQLVDDVMAENITGDALSNIRIDIKSNDLNASNTVQNPLPSFIGLTETETRKKLANYGLKLKPVYQHSDKHVIGQAFKQHPAATTQIIEGSTITVFFAKEKNKYN